MMRNIQSSAWFRLMMVLYLMALCVSLSHAETASHQDDKISRSAEAQAYHDQIQSILEKKDFGEKELVKRWRLKEQKEEDPEDNAFLKWLKDLLSRSDDSNPDGAVNVAKGIELLLWVLVIGLIVFLLVKYRKQLHSLVTGMTSEAETELPSTMFGLDVKKTSMPEDVVSSAQAFWQSGEQRQAIALLLRASLIKLLHEHDCVFLDSDTEGECIARIKQQAPKILSQYMQLLVQVWQQIAYGHQVPTEKVFGTLCRQWQEVF